MPKISNVYLDKKTNRWYFVANLGYDENVIGCDIGQEDFLHKKKLKQPMMNI